jgi:TrmH family RNA methyltransferase
MTVITSRANPRVTRWRALMREARERRSRKRALIEGEHLVAACLDAGWKLETLLLSKSAVARFQGLERRAGPAVVLADAVFRSIADTETPAGIAAEIVLPASSANLGNAPGCIFLEGVQDAGNVGTILRTAAAFGVAHAVLAPGCADAWSAKVLRAGMGAHFAMSIEENADLGEAIQRFGGRLLCTLASGGTALKDADLSGRVGWLFGSEGRGVSAALAARSTQQVTIPMTGSAESLNVAAAAAICLYEAARKRG